MLETLPLPLRLKIGLQIMRIQRNFPYRIKQYIHHLPPIYTPTDGTTLVILTLRKTFVESLWTAYSWLHFLTDKPALQIVMDGEVSDEERKKFSRLFPTGRIASLESCIQNSETLSQPFIHNFYQFHKFGKPLILKLALQEKTDILFSDPDVLVFQTPDEIIHHIREGVGCFFVEKNAQSISEWIANRAVQLSLKLTRDFNSGVLLIPKQSLSIELCNALLEGWSPEIPDYFPEQTIFDVLMTAAQAHPLPSGSYLVSNAGMWFWENDTTYESIKIRHFVGNVRHRMYTSGYPMMKQLFESNR
ncbi:hypothetical protein [Leptolyngbya sp. ST-U4]|uniref:hypothetical protein n=1 Tax=Leptolyngbya sp. ST-U4 TaxID=2933912 RepID=UPI0019A6612A|nr:hypothetical protein [Cyanobacteria bacterium FACHB-502]